MSRTALLLMLSGLYCRLHLSDYFQTIIIIIKGSRCEAAALFLLDPSLKPQDDNAVSAGGPFRARRRDFRCEGTREAHWLDAVGAQNEHRTKTACF